MRTGQRRWARVGRVPPWVVFSALAALWSVACDASDSAFPSGSAVEDSAQRAMVATDFSAELDSGYVLGRDMPPYPSGVESISGAVILGQGTSAEVEWGFDHVRIGSRPALLLKRVIDLVREPMMSGDSVVGTRTTPRWRVEHVVSLPPYDETDRVVYSCERPDGAQVVALGPYRRDLRTVQPVRAAWGLDSSSARLIEIDPVEVRCGRYP